VLVYPPLLRWLAVLVLVKQVNVLEPLVQVLKKGLHLPR
jgi:hypothetical protein